MRIDTVTLEKDDMDFFAGRIPTEVTRNTGEDGYYTIGAVDEGKNLLGVAQFCVGVGERGHTEAGLYYIYVEKGKRKRGVGRTLLSDVLSILKKSGIERIFAFPGKDYAIEAFFENTGFENVGSTYQWRGKKIPGCWMRQTV